MKRMIIFVMLVATISSCGPDNGELPLEDPAFRKCVQYNIDDWESDVTVETIGYVECNSRNITSLSGIHHMKGLEVLLINSNPIEDYTGIEGK